MMAYVSTNPATGEKLAEVPEFSPRQLEKALARSAAEFRDWRETDLAHRAQLLLRIAELLERDAAHHAQIMAREMGKPVAAGEAEAKKCAWACRYYAEQGPGFLEPQYVDTDAAESFVRYDPLGPIFAIMPWNFPYWQLIRHAAPALMAGNVILLKHTHHTPQCGIALEQLFRDAGAPEGVFQTLLIDNDAAARVIADPRVSGVTLTGSTRAGRIIAENAGRHLKKTVLELGGSDPFIVFPDADLAEAARVGAQARCLNSGQSCIAAKRFIVHVDAIDRFTELFVDHMQRMKVGDPMDPSTEVGPMARSDLRDTLQDQVDRSVALGARVLCGGKIPDGPGFFYPPTVLNNLAEDAPVRREETFGPVAAIIPFETEAEAVTLANETEFGLGASLWTASRDRIRRLTVAIDAGSVFVNGLVKSDPRLPFGGVKNSGYGRELSREGMLEFVNQKTVWIK
jgi:succinate-semialdehyde dehydrogenase/glutarate-semialdehyde dehydrogenase